MAITNFKYKALPRKDGPFADDPDIRSRIDDLLESLLRHFVYVHVRPPAS
jgi:hypothetical protein